MPHFCSCYYHSEKKTLFLSARSQRGYQKMIEVLEHLEYYPPAEPDYLVTPLMSFLTEKIVKQRE